MFIQNMTSDELVQEYRADIPEIEKNNERIDKSTYVSDLLRKGRKKDSVSFVRYCKTTRNNTYINVFQYFKKERSTRKSVHWDWRVYSFGLMQTYKGTCAIGFFDNAGLAIVFQPHFFNRYKERFMKECDWQVKNALCQAKKVEDIIPIYIRRNPNTTWINTKSKFNGKEHIFAPVNDGVALIQWDGKYIQANTFITETMYSEQQHEMVGKARCVEQLQQEKDKLFQKLVTLMCNDTLDNNSQLNSLQLCKEKNL